MSDEEAKATKMQNVVYKEVLWNKEYPILARV